MERTRRNRFGGKSPDAPSERKAEFTSDFPYLLYLSLLEISLSLSLMEEHEECPHCSYYYTPYGHVNRKPIGFPTINHGDPWTFLLTS